MKHEFRCIFCLCPVRPKKRQALPYDLSPHEWEDRSFDMSFEPGTSHFSFDHPSEIPKKDWYETKE